MAQLTPISCTARLEIPRNANLPGSLLTNLNPRQPTNSRKAAFRADNITPSSIKKQQLLRIMNDYSDFPPLKYLLRVLKGCPKSALLYVQIWKKKNKHMNLVAIKKDIRKDYLFSPTMFRNLLAPLMFLNLIHFVESDEKFQIDILGPHVND